VCLGEAGLKVTSLVEINCLALPHRQTSTPISATEWSIVIGLEPDSATPGKASINTNAAMQLTTPATARWAISVAYARVMRETKDWVHA
jgi:hypothetical protein